MVHPFRYAAILGLISLLCIAQSSINQPAPYEAGPNPDGLMFQQLCNRFLVIDFRVVTVQSGLDEFDE